MTKKEIKKKKKAKEETLPVQVLHGSMAKPTKIPLHLLFIAIALACADSARILDQVDPQPFVLVNPPAALGPSVDTGTTIFPSGSGPEPQVLVSPPVVMGPSVGPIEISPGPVAQSGPQPQVLVGPPVVVGPSVDPTTKTPPLGPSPNALPPPPSAPISFFMHDILGGSHPSARVVTGIIAHSDTTGLPFSKPNNNFFPLPGGVPLINGNNHLPTRSGLNGAQTDNALQNSANNKNVHAGKNQPFVTAGQLPSGATLQRLIFGSMTTIDDELTEGKELGSAVIGRAQGFYFASSLDGTSQTIALTVMLHEQNGDDEDDDHHGQRVEDTISFFGVHRTASPESQVAVVGGTGKFEKTRGYATIESLHNPENQHTTDGADTILHFSVYLSE